MTQLKYSILLIVSILVLHSCDYGERREKDSKYASVPRYEKINWMKAHKWGKLSSEDKKRKAQVCDKLYRDAWLSNDVSAGMLIAQHGKIIYEKYTGMADLEKGVKLSAHSPLHIASTSKVMTAVVVLKLVENKKLNLDDTLGKYFKGFPYPGVTVRDLLDHRSGLPNYIYFSDNDTIWNKSKMLHNQDVLDIMIKHKPAAAGIPNTHFSYNNTNFVLLALLIEKATGLSYPEAMKYILFEPLGMKDSYVLEFEKDTSKCAKSYYNNGRPWKLEYLDATYGDKNIYCTPRDMFRLDCAMYADKFLPAELKKLATRGYSYESDGIKNYGLGIRIMEWPDGKKFLYHNGWWHGTNTVYVRDFAHEAVIIAFGNKKSRSVYAPFSLVTMFGNYALPVDSSILHEQDSIRLMQLKQDSIEKAEKRLLDSIKMVKEDSAFTKH